MKYQLDSIRDEGSEDLWDSKKKKREAKKRSTILESLFPTDEY